MSSVRDPELVSRPAEDKLLGLHEELDFADAAAPELHVMARDRDLGVALHGMNLPLHRVNVGDGRVVEIFAPDERRKLLAGNSSPSSMSPATGRALIKAARSQFWPKRFVVVSAASSDTATGVEPGSGRSRRSTRKT